MTSWSAGLDETSRSSIDSTSFGRVRRFGFHRSRTSLPAARAGRPREPEAGNPGLGRVRPCPQRSDRGVRGAERSARRDPDVPRLDGSRGRLPHPRLPSWVLRRNRGQARRVLAVMRRGCSREHPRDSTPSPEGLVHATWPVAQRLEIPADWVSGYYFAHFQLASGPDAGKVTTTWFVVREAPGARRAPILVQASPTTWQAYNGWGAAPLRSSKPSVVAPRRSPSIGPTTSPSSSGRSPILAFSPLHSYQAVHPPSLLALSLPHSTGQGHPTLPIGVDLLLPTPTGSPTRRLQTSWFKNPSWDPETDPSIFSLAPLLCGRGTPCTDDDYRVTTRR